MATKTFCGQCGNDLGETAAFCPRCGVPRHGGSAPANAPAASQPLYVQQIYQAVEGVRPELIKPRIKTRLPRFIKQQLHATEAILAAYKCSIFDHHRKHDVRHDRVLLTTERVITYRTALIHKSMAEMSYRQITGVRYNKGVIHGKVVLDGGNFGLTLGRIGNEDARFAEMIVAGFVAGRPYAIGN